ncbi:MAG TPA: DUF424 family protein [Candidatus Nanoarchaeia archaeon]|nr:DUF424 family protein [Candidatus Nanoarchaeia archaeon]
MKQKTVYLKVHSTGERFGNRYVIAVCDKDLIGKTIENKKYKIKITERFYKGEEMNEAQVIGILKDAGNVNIMGKRAVEIALKSGIISEKNIIKIGKVKHAQSTSFL